MSPHVFSISFSAWLAVLFCVLLPCRDAPGESAIRRAEWEKAVARHRGSGPVLRVQAPRDGARTELDQVGYSGCTEPGAELTIDRKPIRTNSLGAFAGALDLKPGSNTFVFRATRRGHTTRKTVEVYRVPPAKAMPRSPLAIGDKRLKRPDDAQELLPGDVLRVQCQGSPGRRAWFQIGRSAERHPMRELPVGQGEASYAGVYEGTYTVKPDDAFDKDRVRFTIEDASGNDSRSKSAYAEGTLTTIWSEIQGYARVIEDDTPLCVSSALDARMTHLQAGTVVEIIGRRGSSLRVGLGETQSAWIAAGDVQRLGAQIRPGRSRRDTGVRLGALSLSGDGQTTRSATLDIALEYPDDAIQTPPYPLPFTIDAGTGDATLVLTLWGLEGREFCAMAREESPTTATLIATPLTDLQRQVAGSALVERIDCRWRDDLTVVVTLTLRHRRVWGASADFRGGHLRLRIAAPPPSVDKAKPLAGLKILIDAGHGGDDSGAIGPAGLTEADGNLEIARRLATRLGRGGAKATLMRSSDAYIGLERRAEIVESSDADLFLSIHNNSVGDESDPSRVRGPAMFFTYGHQLALAWQLYQAVPKPEGTRLEGPNVRQRSFRVTRRCLQVPGALAECLFLSNPDDELLLLDSTFLDKLADSLYGGIESFVRLSRAPVAQAEPKLVGEGAEAERTRTDDAPTTLTESATELALQSLIEALPGAEREKIDLVPLAPANPAPRLRDVINQLTRSALPTTENEPEDSESQDVPRKKRMQYKFNSK